MEEQERRANSLASCLTVVLALKASLTERPDIRHKKREILARRLVIRTTRSLIEISRFPAFFPFLVITGEVTELAFACASCTSSAAF